MHMYVSNIYGGNVAHVSLGADIVFVRKHGDRAANQGTSCLNSDWSITFGSTNQNIRTLRAEMK